MKKAFLGFGIFFLLLITMLSEGICQTDQEGKKFKTIKIGDQVWMAENLDVEHYRNGDLIPQVKDKNEWLNLKTGAWCYYENDPSNGKKYGKLYNWYAVNDTRGLAPEGWHIPTHSEFEKMWMPLFYEAEVLMKEGSGKKNGFSALFAGSRLYLGANPFFSDINSSTSFWTATEDEDTDVFGYKSAHSLALIYGTAMPMNFSGAQINGYSVRCIKNSTNTISNNFLIQPGVGVGKIMLGSNRADVLSVLGKPQMDSYSWSQKDSWEDGLLVYYRNGIVYQINVLKPKYHTASGLTISTEPKEFLKAYPKSKKLCCEFYGASGGEEWMSWDAITEGIALQKVSSITGTGGFSDAIIVHIVNEPIKQFELDGEKCKACR